MQEHILIIDDDLELTALIKKFLENNKFKVSSFDSPKKALERLSKKNTYYFSESIMDFLQYADGKNNINEISVLIKKNLKFTIKICKLLLKKKLIEI